MRNCSGPLRPLLLVLPLLAACTSMQMADEALRLQGTSWTLAQLAGQPARGGATLSFADGQAQGTDGCNRFSGPFTADGQSLGFGNLASTQMACAEPVMGEAQAFTAALGATRAARIEAGRLLLLDAAGTVLATLAPADQSLAGGRWQVTGYNNGRNAVASVLADSTLTLEFGADGRLGGSAGCNAYKANWSAVAGNLAIGAPAATRRACPADGVMQQEAAFLQALPLTASARIEGGRLELRGHDGALLVSATRE